MVPVRSMEGPLAFDWALEGNSIMNTRAPVRVDSGLVIVDKPAGWTSHDVVGRIRRLAGTRRVGHAGTLDPMATGVLVVGIERATRLLGHLAATEKAYNATIRLGQTTNTDDAEGEVIAERSAAKVGEGDMLTATKRFKGAIQQVPPQVSAVKIDGKRAYKRARSGEDVELAARTVTVYALALRDVHRHGSLVDIEASVVCSTGTYIRALARDLGKALGVGGHLAELRRTRVGPYYVEDARTVDELAQELRVTPIAEAAAAAFPQRIVTAAEAKRVAHGAWLPALDREPGPTGVFGPDGTFLALVEEKDGAAKPLAVFAE